MVDAVLEQLAQGPRTQLHDLATCDVPRLPGIYALWHDAELLYVGIARVDPADTSNTQAAGVPGRLNTYRRCRITSDFALGCALRYVIPFLSEEERQSLATGAMTQRHLQPAVQKWVWANVTFSAVIVDAQTAMRTETIARRSGLPGVGRPAFNPS